jgi:hypothetical protein
MKTERQSQVLDWLLKDSDPGVRYLALRDLLGLPQDDSELIKARIKAHSKGPIATILSEMNPQGYWGKPGPGYNPKYRSSVWSLILLSQLGASTTIDERISKTCHYLLDHSMTKNGQFSVNGAPSGTIDCLQGNLCAALTMLGCEDVRLRQAFEWMARSVTGEDIAPATERDAFLRYYAYKCGPNFSCGVNNRLPCGWGATKVMMAFAALPKEHHTPLIKSAIQQGVEFLFSVDPATAAYPCGNYPKPNKSWWKFGFPVFYVTDILQVVEVLVALGYGDDPRLKNAFDLVQSKQDTEGCWLLDYEYSGKTWVDFGMKKQPNKWVTLRALRVLEQLG